MRATFPTKERDAYACGREEDIVRSDRGGKRENELGTEAREVLEVYGARSETM
jgi:hypothetical protein